MHQNRAIHSNDQAAGGCQYSCLSREQASTPQPSFNNLQRCQTDHASLAASFEDETCLVLMYAVQPLQGKHACEQVAYPIAAPVPCLSSMQDCFVSMMVQWPVM